MKKLITTILAIIGALCILAFLLSCTSRDISASEAVRKPTAYVGESYVYEIHLSDGTLCAVVDKNDYRGGTGITCNWKPQ